MTVRVKDENDQVPRFSQASYAAQLSQGTRPGKWPGKLREDREELKG